MIINIICTIVVTVCMKASNGDCIGWHSKTQQTGHIISKNEYNYLVDFSAVASEHLWMGDYSKVIVPVSDCVEVKL